MYPYVTGLDNPQTYQYSQYSGKPFLKEYLSIRKSVLSSLNDPSKITLHDLTKEEILDRLTSETMATEIFRLLLTLQIKYPDAKEAYDYLSMFIKKYEVFKRLYTNYVDSRKGSDDCKDLEVYYLFSLNLALYYKTSKKLKFLNCLLKVNDMLCSEKDKIDDTSAFFQSLTIEIGAINELMAKKKVSI